MDNKQTTVLAKLVEYFEQQLRIAKERKIKYKEEDALSDAIDVCKRAIKMERKQMIDFAKYCSKNTDYATSYEDCYNQTYTQKQQPTK